jgi:quercetin dioxygenase-like cupin family protein
MTQTTDNPAERVRVHPEERFASPAQKFDLDAVARDLAAEPTATAQGHRQRMLFRRGNATLSLFLFDAGAALREHRTNGTVLIQVLRGRMTVTAGGERHDLPGGSVLSMAAGVPHDVYADVASRMLLTVSLQPPLGGGTGT